MNVETAKTIGDTIPRPDPELLRRFAEGVVVAALIANKMGLPLQGILDGAADGAETLGKFLAEGLTADEADAALRDRSLGET